MYIYQRKNNRSLICMQSYTFIWDKISAVNRIQHNNIMISNLIFDDLHQKICKIFLALSRAYRLYALGIMTYNIIVD